VPIVGLLVLFSLLEIIWPAGRTLSEEWDDSLGVRAMRDEIRRQNPFDGRPLPMIPFEQNGKWGYRTPAGLELIVPRFDNARPFTSGMARVGMGTWVPLAGSEKDSNRRTFSGQFGYIDDRGLLIIPCEFDEAEDFKDGSARVRKGERRGSIDAAGNWIAER
jgi:hypothetical protein